MLVNPDEIKKIKQKKEEAKQEVKEPIVPFPGTFDNYGQSFGMLYSSEGRFSIKGKRYFKDYSSDNVLDLSMIDHNELPKTVISILDANTVSEDVSMRNSTPEELIETLVSLKGATDPAGAKEHVHQWVCDCQLNLPQELQKINKTSLDLTTLSFQTASQADDELREKLFKPVFEAMSDDDFQNYLKVKYDSIPKGTTKETELSNMTIKDVMTTVDNVTGIKYSFMFPRMGHLIEGYEIAEEETRWPIEKIKQKKVKSQVEHEKNQKAINDLEKERAKKTLKYITALSLYSIDNEVITDSKEKIRLQEEGLIPAAVFEHIKRIHNSIEIGLKDEREFTCPHCGNTSKRLLQHETNLLHELLPIPNSDDDADTRNLVKGSSRISVFFS